MNKIALVLSVIAMALSAVTLYLLMEVNSEVKGIKVVSSQIEQQSSLLHRSLGKIIPYTLPPEMAKQLSQIEMRLANESNWPTTTTEVLKLNNEMANLVKEMPSWVQEDSLPKLLPMRWEIGALAILAEKPSDNSLDEYLKNIESTLMEQTDGVSPVLVARLKAKQKETESLISKTAQDFAIETAKQAVTGNGDPQAALRLLEDYSNDESKNLRSSLREVIATNEITRNIASIKVELQREVAIKDVEMKEYLLSRSHQAALDVRLRMAEWGIANNKKLSDELDSVEFSIKDGLAAIRKERDAKEIRQLKDYQIWALGNIKQVKKYDVGMLEGSSAKKAARETIRDDLIRYMSAINQSILDEAVMQLFRQVYADRFQKLDEAEQLEVLKAFATATKRTLE